MREFAKRILNPDVQPDCFVGLWPSRNDTLTSHVRVLQEDLEQYFQGIAVPWRTPLDFASATAFQRRVWQAIHTIPFGEVRSYGWLAEAADHPASVRAVANACGANPLPILIACHRVVASDGSLGGFSAGLAWKRKLLQVERNSTRHDYAPLTMEARTPDNYAC